MKNAAQDILDFSQVRLGGDLRIAAEAVVAGTATYEQTKFVADQVMNLVMNYGSSEISETGFEEAKYFLSLEYPKQTGE